MTSPCRNKVVGSYRLVKRTGRGSFATVWQAEQIQTSMSVAIKVIANKSVASPDAQIRFNREVNLIKQMDHPFIAKCYDVITEDEYTYLVMEFCENGNLLDFVNNNGRLSETQARRYFSQLLSALEYLHNVKFVAHRDLKAENVLLDRYNNIRLIDFGLSNIFTEENPQLSTACGSPAYASPEMICGKKYTKAADIWSAGVLLYAMVCGELPFDDGNVQRLLQKIAHTEPTYPPFLSQQLYDLLTKLMNKKPEQRITLEKIKEHPWFSATEYRDILELSFSSDEQWLVKGLDKEIIDKIGSFGVDTKEVTSAVLHGTYGPEFALYQLFRRDQITEKVRNFMLSLNAKAQRPAVRPPSGEGSRFPIPLVRAGGGAPVVPIPLPRGRGQDVTQVACDRRPSIGDIRRPKPPAFANPDQDNPEAHDPRMECFKNDGVIRRGRVNSGFGYS